MLGSKVSDSVLPFLPDKFLLLKDYPNKGVLARSKVQKFTSKQQFFQLRSTLFTEICYLLLKVEYQQRTAFISKNIYQSISGYVFMLFSFDSSYQDRFHRIAPGSLLPNILDLYYLIFGKPTSHDVEDDLFEDYQLREIYKDSQSLISYLSQLNEKCQDYYFKSLNGNGQVKLPLASPFSILKKLESSAVFKQYALFLKCDTAALSKFITSSFSSRNIQVSDVYLQLLDTQQSFFRTVRIGGQGSDLAAIFEEYTSRFLHLLKLMQADNCIKLITLDEDKPDRQKPRTQALAFEAVFIMNLKKLPYTSKTAEERSESEGSNQFSIEQKERYRQKDYLQTLSRFKNEILFKIQVSFNAKNGELNAAVQGQGQWLIEQLHYNLLHRLWLRLFNLWHSSVSKATVEGEVEQWQLRLWQKHPVIASRRACSNQTSFASGVIKLIDQIAIAFLVFENVFKNLWKCSQNMIEPPTPNLAIIESDHFIQGLVDLLSALLKSYSLLQQAMHLIDSKYLQS